MEKQTPTYYSILTAAVRYSDKINDFEKLLFSELTALSNAKGYATASNNYLAFVFNKSVRTISRSLERLKSNGFIRSENVREGKKIVSRKIFVISEAEQRNLNAINGNEDIDKFVEYSSEDIDKNGNAKFGNAKNGVVNNTSSFNNTSNTNIKDKDINVADKSATANKPKTKKRIYDEQDQELLLAKYLFGLMKLNNEFAKEPNFQNWANDIRLMHERDDIPYEQIKNAITWCQKDSFWKANILSAKKLREKFPTLYLAAKNKSNNWQQKNEQKKQERLNATDDYDLPF